MRVKLLQIYIRGSIDNYGDFIYDSSSIIDETSWEEISEEDCRLLELWVDKENRNRYEYDNSYDQYCIIKEVPKKIPLIIQEKIEELKKEQEAKEKRREKEEAKRKKQQEERKAKEVERKRKQLEKLKKELEDA